MFPYFALVGLPLAALGLVAIVAAARWLLGLGPLGADDASLVMAYTLLGAFAIAALVQLVAVPWAIVLLVRHPELRRARPVIAIVFGALFAVTICGILGVTAMYAAGP